MMLMKACYRSTSPTEAKLSQKRQSVISLRAHDMDSKKRSLIADHRAKLLLDFQEMKMLEKSFIQITA